MDAFAGGCVAVRSETDVESVLWAGNQAALAARHAAHRDGPFAKLEGAARVDHCNLQAKAILVALVAKLKGTADARAIYNQNRHTIIVYTDNSRVFQCGL